MAGLSPPEEVHLPPPPTGVCGLPGKAGWVKAFRFGVMSKGQNVVEVARRAEELGYSSLCLPDHLGQQASPLLALAAAAAVTTRLRLCPLVCCNDFRHPALLAREAATLQQLSQGRLELGLGAGWMESDYRSLGKSMDRPGLRLQRLEEALGLMRALWAEGPCRWQGTHYQVEDGPARLRPPSPIPLVLGGGGPRMLSLASRWADIVGLNVNLRSPLLSEIDFSAEAWDKKAAWVREAAGPRWEELEIQLLLFASRCTQEVEPAYAELAQQMEQSPEILRHSPSLLVGGPQAIGEELLARRERWGISYVIIREEQMEEFSPVVQSMTGI